MEQTEEEEESESDGVPGGEIATTGVAHSSTMAGDDGARMAEGVTGGESAVAGVAHSSAVVGDAAVRVPLGQEAERIEEGAETAVTSAAGVRKDTR